MLNIGINDININISKTQYPVYFEKKNICVHCGAENSLIFVDKFGKETNQEIHPFDHIKCRKCGSIYSILWQRDKNNGKMFPIPVDPNLKLEFINILNKNNIKSDGNKIL